MTDTTTEQDPTTTGPTDGGPADQGTPDEGAPDSRAAACAMLTEQRDALLAEARDAYAWSLERRRAANTESARGRALEQQAAQVQASIDALGTTTA